MADVRLIHGDCLIEVPKLKAKSVNCVICDPPYGFFNTKKKWDVPIPLDPMWKFLTHVCKPNAMIILFGAEPFSSYLRINSLENKYRFRHKYDVIWQKDRPTGSNHAQRQPMRCHEIMSHFYFTSPTYNPQMRKGKAGKWKLKKAGQRRDSLYGESEIPKGYDNPTGEKYPITIIKFNSPNNNHGIRHHPTEKPVDLLCNLVKQNSNEGDCVLDFCAGSGSTGVACIKTGRDFIGIERDAGYFNVMRDRLAKPIIRENEVEDWEENMPLARGLFDG